MEISEEPEADDGPEHDPRTPDQRRYDAIGDQIREASLVARQTAELVREFIAEGNRGQTQTVIHKTTGMGGIGYVLTAVCVLCVLFVLVEFSRQNSAEVEYRNHVDGQLRDLDAWRSVHSNDIAYLKAEVKKTGEKK